MPTAADPAGARVDGNVDRGAGRERRVEGAARSVFSSVRVRITIAALLVVAVTLAVGGAGLVFLVHRSLVNNARSAVISEADNVGSVVAQGVVPTHLVGRPRPARPGHDHPAAGRRPDDPGHHRGAPR